MRAQKQYLLTKRSLRRQREQKKVRFEFMNNSSKLLFQFYRKVYMRIPTMLHAPLFYRKKTTKKQCNSPLPSSSPCENIIHGCTFSRVVFSLFNDLLFKSQSWFFYYWFKSRENFKEKKNKEPKTVKRVAQ